MDAGVLKTQCLLPSHPSQRLLKVNLILPSRFIQLFPYLRFLFPFIGHGSPSLQGCLFRRSYNEIQLIPSIKTVQVAVIAKKEEAGREQGGQQGVKLKLENSILQLTLFYLGKWV